MLPYITSHGYGVERLLILHGMAGGNRPLCAGWPLIQQRCLYAVFVRTTGSTQSIASCSVTAYATGAKLTEEFKLFEVGAPCHLCMCLSIKVSYHIYSDI